MSQAFSTVPNAADYGRANELLWVVKDTVSVATAATSASFYTNLQIGATRKTRQETNMLQAGRPWGNNDALITGLRIIVPNRSSGATAVTVRDADELLIGFYELKIEGQTYLEFDGYDAPAGQGIFMQSDVGAAAPTHLMNVNGMPVRSNVLIFNPPIKVRKQESVEVAVSWNPAITLSATTPLISKLYSVVARPPR